MKQRIIKFRAWDRANNTMTMPFNLEDIRDEEHQANYENFDYIMQYTGLKDKNGKEIYEGDIMMGFFLKEPMEVYYDNKLCAFQLRNKNTLCWRQGLIFIKDEDERKKDLKVIGNIYENKDLLK